MSRTHALAIFRAAVKAADPVQAVRQHVQLHNGVLTVGGAKYPLNRFDRIQVIGAGKASARMAFALEQILGSRIDGGWVNVPDGQTVRVRRVHLHAAGHPIPDKRSVEGARRIAEIAKGAGKRDLLLCVISGGASALMALPAAGVTLARKKAMTRKLLASGASIHEMNAVRKHLSAIKGGHLAELAYPATLVTLILSDVIGDDLDTIGSGPTVPDRSTCADVEGILRARGIGEVPLTETPKAGNPVFRSVRNVIVGSNRQSIVAAAQKARALGYETLILSTTIDGETRDVARMHAAIVRELVGAPSAVATNARARAIRGWCFLSGGETTVTLRGKGKGGRNQEFVLAALDALGQTSGRGVTIFSAGTDGIDGPTDAAGAVWNTSHNPASDARASLAANDSYHFFEKEGGLVKTGPTGTNVMDVRMLLL